MKWERNQIALLATLCLIISRLMGLRMTQSNQGRLDEKGLTFVGWKLEKLESVLVVDELGYDSLH